MGSRMRGAAVAVAVVVALTGCASAAAPAPLAGAAESAVRPTVVMIGDSIMTGNGLDPSESWPAVLADERGWDLLNLSEDGAGFVAVGVDGGTFETTATALAASGVDPDAILVSASSNDLGIDPDELAGAADTVFTTLHDAFPATPLVGLSSMWGDTEPPSELGDINDAVRAAAGDSGATWIDIGEPLGGRPDLMQADDVHPTPEGQLLLAEAVGDDLEAALRP